MTPRETIALVCFALSAALFVVAGVRRRQTGRWLPLLVAACVVTGCCAAPRPAPRPYTFTRFDADGRRETVWTEVDSAGGWIQRSNGWTVAP